MTGSVSVTAMAKPQGSPWCLKKSQADPLSPELPVFRLLWL